MPKFCYIHIPFCKSICSYCDFCKLYYNEELVDKYLDALAEEINSKYKNESLETIYIGGGTPSSLNIKQLEKLFKILERLTKSNNIEYTIEGNIESTDINKLKLYKENGINRLSFGLETINKNNLNFLNRTLNIKKVQTIINQAREIGFQNINLDLMYALPKETITDLEKDLDYILSLDIEHISTYSLIIEEHTKIYLEKVKNISEDLDAKMYNYICQRLNTNEYEHYEISNFSKKGYQSKHNTCYWSNEEYYGFGLGASSYIDNERITNTRSINKYLNKEYIKEKEKITSKTKIEYEIMLNLRKNTGIDLKCFKDKYQKELKDLYDYKNLVKNKLLIESNNKLFIPEDKWYISNEIIVRLLGSEINE
ncbi:MAG: radical SAM family heme chaperone HemW [Bacilli bacterium]|nr:radical SAM family heme chaperone HemW [Bacilli bacterium]